MRARIGANGLVIGRTAPSDLQIAVADISRKHCRIDVESGAGVLVDLGSTNGTFMDGKRLDRPVRLVNGSQFSAGSIPFRYERRDLREVAAEEALNAELWRAEEYVRAILPQPIPKGPVQAEWCFVPSSRLGGDAFGYQYLDAENFAGFVLDVSGHGIGSAMHAANVANTLRRRALPEVDFHDPAQVAAGLNDVFPMEEHNGLMLTMWYFCYHLPSRELRYCAAGHHAAYLVTPDNPEPVALWARGTAIGMLEVGKWAVGRTVMSPGVKLLVFSDGAYEVLTPDGRELTLEDLRTVIKQSGPAGVAEPERIFQAVRAVSRPGPLDDDFSMVILRFE